MHVVSVADLEI